MSVASVPPERTKSFATIAAAAVRTSSFVRPSFGSGREYVAVFVSLRLKTIFSVFAMLYHLFSKKDFLARRTT